MLLTVASVTRDSDELRTNFGTPFTCELLPNRVLLTLPTGHLQLPPVIRANVVQITVRKIIRPNFGQNSRKFGIRITKFERMSGELRPNSWQTSPTDAILPHLSTPTVLGSSCCHSVRLTSFLAHSKALVPPLSNVVFILGGGGVMNPFEEGDAQKRQIFAGVICVHRQIVGHVLVHNFVNLCAGQETRTPSDRSTPQLSGTGIRSGFGHISMEKIRLTPRCRKVGRGQIVSQFGAGYGE